MDPLTSFLLALALPAVFVCLLALAAWRGGPPPPPPPGVHER